MPVPQISLDPVQIAAAEAAGSPVIVLGGSGHGKTTALVARTAALLEGGTPPEAIVFLTCTDWLATDVRQQLEVYTEHTDLARRVFIGTPEQWAARVLRAGGADLIGLPRHFSVWDHQRVAQAITLVAGPDFQSEQAPDFPTDLLLTMIGLHQARPAEYALPRDRYDLPALMRRFLGEKRRQGGLDLHDLVPMALKAMTENVDFRQTWSDAYCKHLMVDDFQELTPVQSQLITASVGSSTSITVAANLLLCADGGHGLRVPFLSNRAAARTFWLFKDYRHTSSLVEVANRIVSDPSVGGLRNFESVAVRPAGQPPEVLQSAGQPDDLGNIVLGTVKILQARGLALQDIACICPDPDTAVVVKAALDYVGLPYRWLGDPDQTPHGDAQRLTHLLEWTLNPKDIFAFSLAAFGDAWNRRGHAASQVAAAILELSRVPGADPVAVVEQQLAQFKPGSAIHQAVSGVLAVRQALEQAFDAPETRPDDLWRIAQSLFHPDQFDIPFPGHRMADAPGLPFAASRESPKDRLRQALDRLHPQLHPAPVTGADVISLCTVSQARGREWLACMFFDPGDDKLRSAEDFSGDRREHWNRVRFVGITRSADELHYVDLNGPSHDLTIANGPPAGLHDPVGHRPADALAGRDSVPETDPADAGQVIHSVAPNAPGGPRRGPSSTPTHRSREEVRSRTTAPAAPSGDDKGMPTSTPSRPDPGRNQRPRAESTSSPQRPASRPSPVPAGSPSPSTESPAAKSTKKAANPWKSWEVILCFLMLIGIITGLSYLIWLLVPLLRRTLGW